MLGATCAELEGTKLNGLEMDIVIKIIVSSLNVSKYDQIWEHFNLLCAIVVLLLVIILVPTYKMQIDTHDCGIMWVKKDTWTYGSRTVWRESDKASVWVIDFIVFARWQKKTWPLRLYKDRNWVFFA